MMDSNSLVGQKVKEFEVRSLSVFMKVRADRAQIPSLSLLDLVSYCICVSLHNQNKALSLMYVYSS